MLQAAEEEAKLTPAQKKLPKETQKALATPYLKRTRDQQRAILELVMAKDAGFKKLNDPLREREKGVGPKISTLVIQEIGKPRETRLFIKDDFARPDVVVERSVPAFPHPVQKSEQTGPSRLDLAKWLVDKGNPLTARVIMNRVWQQSFSPGIVETENDFGIMGAVPTHPGLLDWLAVEFMDSGWDLKHMQRLIVTSATYRQPSKDEKSPQAAAQATRHSVDPKNYLLWHQIRLRFDAEVVRDVMLAASGLLCEKVGGPPV